MGALRDRMIEEMKLRNFSAATQSQSPEPGLPRSRLAQKELRSKQITLRRTDRTLGQRRQLWCTSQWIAKKTVGGLCQKTIWLSRPCS